MDPDSTPRTPARASAGVRETSLAAAFYTLLTILLAYPLSVRPASSVIADNPDTHFFIWTLAWNAHAVLAQPLALFDANIYHPEPNTLAYSENLLGTGPLASPVIWVTGNPVLALNLVMLVSCALCGLGAHLLARRAGLGPLGATIAGLVFLAAPPRFFRIGQAHLATVHWLPFGLASLHAYLDEGRARHLRLALAFFTLQALTSGHGTVFLGVAMATLVTWRVLLGEPLAPLRRLRDAGLPGLALLLPIALVYAPYRAAQQHAGLVRTLENWLPSPASYLASPSHLHQWLRALLTSVDFNAAATAWLFPGITTLVLALAALLTWPSMPRRLGLGWRECTRRDAGLFYLTLALLAVLMFVPPPWSLWPHLYWLPGLNFIRVPSRFMILAMLGLGVAAGAGFQRLTHHLRPGARAVAGVLVGTTLLAEYASMPLVNVPYRVDVPAVDRWIGTLPGPVVIAEVPVPSRGDVGAFERHHTMAMLHATAHWKKTVHGYSGLRPPRHEQLYDELYGFPDEASLAALDGFGVTHVVLHEALCSPERLDAIRARLVRFHDRLRLVHAEGSGHVYALLPAPGTR